MAGQLETRIDLAGILSDNDLLNHINVISYNTCTHSGSLSNISLHVFVSGN